MGSAWQGYKYVRKDIGMHFCWCLLAVLFLFGGGIFNICLLQISLALIILEILGEKLKLGVAREKGICYNIVGKGI